MADQVDQSRSIYVQFGREEFRVEFQGGTVRQIQDVLLINSKRRRFTDAREVHQVVLGRGQKINSPGVSITVSIKYGVYFSYAYPATVFSSFTGRP